MLHFGPNCGLELFCLVDQGIRLIVLVECSALARAHGHVPGDTAFGISAFVDTAVARITKGHALLAVQQGVALGNVSHMACGATHAVHQPGVGISADVNTKGLPASR